MHLFVTCPFHQQLKLQALLVRSPGVTCCWRKHFISSLMNEPFTKGPIYLLGTNNNTLVVAWTGSATDTPITLRRPALIPGPWSPGVFSSHLFFWGLCLIAIRLFLHMVGRCCFAVRLEAESLENKDGKRSLLSSWILKSSQKTVSCPEMCELWEVGRKTHLPSLPACGRSQPHSQLVRSAASQVGKDEE